jgi:hypothetical protein
MNMWEKKFLKYKIKYNELKKQLKGGTRPHRQTDLYVLHAHGCDFNQMKTLPKNGQINFRSQRGNCAFAKYNSTVCEEVMKKQCTPGTGNLFSGGDKYYDLLVGGQKCFGQPLNHGWKYSNGLYRCNKRGKYTKILDLDKEYQNGIHLSTLIKYYIRERSKSNFWCLYVFSCRDKC